MYYVYFDNRCPVTLPRCVVTVQTECRHRAFRVKGHVRRVGVFVFVHRVPRQLPLAGQAHVVQRADGIFNQLAVVYNAVQFVNAENNYAYKRISGRRFDIIYTQLSVWKKKAKKINKKIRLRSSVVEQFGFLRRFSSWAVGTSGRTTTSGGHGGFALLVEQTFH